MNILIITSCTGDKAVEHPSALTLDDFKKGAEHVVQRESELADLLMPAREIYTGQQHQRLMQGIEKLLGESGGGLNVDLKILSAGYGLVDGGRKLAPYEATFQGMRANELRKWADELGVPQAFRAALSQPFDLSLVLLGDDYLSACAVDSALSVGGPTLLFCGGNTRKRLPDIADLRSVSLGNAEARRFSCGLVALKGELASRILERISQDRTFAHTLLAANDVLALLEKAAVAPASSRQAARLNPSVDQVVQLHPEWKERASSPRMRYFIPEWDDLVDPDYDFENDVHSGGGGDWSNEVYAHQMYPEPNYDGILISKVVAEKSRKKKERINAMGVHRFLRLPREFPIMGDCGAFGYIGEKNPPYSTPEILDYYTRLDFDYGVSIDHLCVASNRDEWKHRYQLTIDNAADFVREHRKQRLDWVPIGAVQGWDPKSYADAAAQMVKMGYSYLGLGGLVRSPTPEIVNIMRAVREQVPREVKIHLFGLARLGGLPVLDSLGVSSVDSASFLRRAWMGTGQNYLTDRGEFVAAIRIPEAGKSFRAKRMVSEGRATSRDVERMDAACLRAMADFDAGRISVTAACDILEEYDQLITPDRVSTRPLLEKTLTDAPWRRCPCAICQKDGVQVIIFRGNNRNRRRGFHNTWLFYQMFQQVLAGKDINVPGRKHLFELLNEFGQGSLLEEALVD